MIQRFKSTNFLLLFGLAIFALGLLFINTCKRIYVDPNEFTEGFVVYQISYPELDTNHLFQPFLPHKMILQVNGKKVKLETKAGLGLFKTGIIADLRDKEGTSFLKMINVRYQSKFDAQFFQTMVEPNEPELQFIDSSMSYLGEEMAFASLQYPWSQEKDTLIFFKNLYTENLNFHNGLGQTDHVLVDYQQRFQGVLMRFTAIEIQRENVSKQEFKLDADYKELSHLDFQKELRKGLSPLRD